MTNKGHANSESTPSAPQSINGWDAAYIDATYAQWQKDPSSVGEQWRQFFAGFDLGLARPAPATPDESPAPSAASGSPVSPHSPASPATAAPTAQRAVDLLIQRYREFGHLAAQLDPLGTTRPFPDALTLESVGLGDEHLGQSFDAGSLPLGATSTLGDIVGALEQTYCGSCGVEFMHISNLQQRQWIEGRVEQSRGKANFAPPRQQRILKKLIDSDAFESFLAMRYVGKKRFGLEGADTIIPMLDAAIESAAAQGAREFCFAFAHRGRVNLLTNVVGKSYEQVLTEFEESWTASYADGGGDVKYHQGHSSDIETASGTVHVTASANASHLEFVNGIALGRTRAKQDLGSDSERIKVVPILVHGDSSFPGQGSVAECFNYMKLPGYDAGGALHIVINNQVGFTTNPCDTFGGNYCTDLAKGFDAPIFHVNGDDPEMCVWAMETAAEFRQAFGRDAVVELWCYRKNGHNETDEPAFTQPLLYRRVRAHTPVAASYRDRLVAQGAITAQAAADLATAVHDRMDAAQTAVKAKPVFPGVAPFGGLWKDLGNHYNNKPVETGVALSTLIRVGSALGEIPDHITPHRTVGRLMPARAQIDPDAKIDWATAEMLAYGTLLLDGSGVRISGQDVERGTFSHRHAIVTCQDTGAKHSPLAALGRFQIWNSPLTENAIVAFELGYSQTDPNALVIWEAQFGDFANGAQVIFDQFMTSGEAKWHRAAGLVLLLPHGYEGQGPEHSSARVERFLQMAANDNFEVAVPSTTAQMFHLLRRQLKRDFRRPLAILTPKSMLRLPEAQSPCGEFVQGHFAQVIDDPASNDFGPVSRVYFCSGKYYHELVAQRAALEDRSCVFVRVEQLAPFPEQPIEAMLKKYRGAQIHWIQEESRNMGAYRYMQANMLDRFGVNPSYVGRPDSASPAVGSTKAHEKQAHALLAQVFPSLGGTASSEKGAAAVASADEPGSTSAKGGAKAREKPARSGKESTDRKTAGSKDHAGSHATAAEGGRGAKKGQSLGTSRVNNG